VAAAILLGGMTYFVIREPSQPPIKNLASSSPSPPAASPFQEDATGAAIRFYLARVKRDPEDIRSQNALAESYLQCVRESGNEDYLPLALNAARASLVAVPPLRNNGGLLAMAHAEFSNHDFAAARDHALQLAQLDPGKSEPYAILGDAYLELGDYERAADAFQKMQLGSEKDFRLETRLARLAFLRGAVEEARQHFTTALDLLLALRKPPSDAVAWCHWQLGETDFAVGKYDAADMHYRDALEISPSYFRALGSFGRLRAAHGDYLGAIAYYEQAVRIVPAVDFMAALGDLYQISGQTRNAAVRYELVEQLAEHSRKVHSSPFDRRIALFYADHDVRLQDAYELAQGEFTAGRQDIYGADALAWTALKSGRLAEAQVAIKEALRLGTLDARLFYHAGMIALATEQRSAAANFLQRALLLNPHFDPLQSEIARKAQP
jgi:tetratricopeptide (TPR) repeat protein